MTTRWRSSGSVAPLLISADAGSESRVASWFPLARVFGCYILSLGAIVAVVGLMSGGVGAPLVLGMVAAMLACVLADAAAPFAARLLPVFEYGGADLLLRVRDWREDDSWSAGPSCRLPWRPLVLVGVLLVPVLEGVAVVSGALVRWALPLSGSGARAVAASPFTGVSPLEALVMLLVVVVFAPIAEERFFRGSVLDAAGVATGRGGAVLITSLFFAAAHYNGSASSIVAVITAFSASLVLSAARHWCGSLVPCVIAHVGYNTIQILLSLSTVVGA